MHRHLTVMKPLAYCEGYKRNQIAWAGACEYVLPARLWHTHLTKHRAPEREANRSPAIKLLICYKEFRLRKTATPYLQGEVRASCAPHRSNPIESCRFSTRARKGQKN